MKKIYKLKSDMCGFKKGTLVAYEEEWSEWSVGDKTYDLRGSIAEGEIAILFGCIRDLNLTTIMEQIKE